ncbi:hypothetical protein RHSIM_Rhsim12G0166200 [Rhododendron simsii]|uniref:Uncharacterized protein n=1 Tax=Rhododendron simsii TaxID=118357 RepID=A0A834GA43_RHOSS|nr:hypothetical protein RHSIM_Rhsim12G0166200 [Rhododendron simsii]
MAVKMGPFSCVATSLSSPFQYRRSSKGPGHPLVSAPGCVLSGRLISPPSFKLILRTIWESYTLNQLGQPNLFNPPVCTLGGSHVFALEFAAEAIYGVVVLTRLRTLSRACGKRRVQINYKLQVQLLVILLSLMTSPPNSLNLGVESKVSTCSPVRYGTAGGRPGLLTFYSRPNQREEEAHISSPRRNQNGLLWFGGPTILVASFVFPSLYLRRILSAVFEDSLLTDFLILFFTEALFYCGVAAFLLLVDHLRRPIVPVSSTYNRNLNPQLGHQISSVAVLVLSIIVPMVTMGFVWPWTGPAASATLAPYLVGIVVQFAFEQYARYIKSPSWPVIPIIFKVYRLHQLNRAAQLVTALSFTVRGAEMTPHNLAINSSLGTLLNVLQFLGVICIWSLSSFLMRFIPNCYLPI